MNLKKLLWSLLLFTAGIFTPLMAQTTTEPSPYPPHIPPPHLQLKEVEYNAGNVYEGDTVKHTFYFTNTGKQPLRIEKIVPSVPYILTSKWDKDKLYQPGETGSFTALFIVPHDVSVHRRTILIFSNAVNNPAKTGFYVNVNLK